MATSIVRGRMVFTHPLDRHAWHALPNASVLQENGIVREIGAYDEMACKHPGVSVLGTGNEIILPGLINAHHHVGLTALQHGVPDQPLELWLVARLMMRNVDPYLDTLYSAFEMIASGVTTVQHVHGWVRGTAKDIGAKADAIIKAYDDIGMRVSYCYSLRDQNRLVYQDDDAFVASLPSDLQAPMRSWFHAFQADLGDSMGLFEDLYRRHNDKQRVKIQLSPANLQWCSDRALTLLSDTSARLDVPLHAHLLETKIQREYALRRGGCTAVEYLDRYGMVTSRLTIGHGIWLSDSDMDRLAETGACVCHNCSSNYRLRSGLAPLNELAARGVTLALGTDDAGLNDDRDMLQEIKLALRAHRHAGLTDDNVPTTAQILSMATAGGARTTPYSATIGTLEVGKSADLVLIDWNDIAYPYLDTETTVLDAVVQRAKTSAVRMTMCNGEAIYRNGQFTRVNQAAALRELHTQLAHELSKDELERRWLSKRIMPYARQFYASYLKDGQRG